MVADAHLTDRPVDETLRAWFAPVLENGSRWCAPNLDTQCAFLRVDDIELPLTINAAEWGNSWVCSPFTHYVSYAQEEVVRAVGSLVGWPAALLLRALGAGLRRADFNRVVMVNNWLMSTNPWPHWDGCSLVRAVDAMCARWPDHALVFRSLNERADAAILRALAAVGARLIPSRQVWWFEMDSPAVRRSTDRKRDLALLLYPNLECVPHEHLTASDFGPLTALHHELYLQKYSRHNPAYTAAWLTHLWQNRLLQFTALREAGGPFVGVEACGVFHGTMVSPVVGYALSKPRKLGLYRRLTTVPMRAAEQAGAPLNLSAGVGQFKASRGGEPVMEFIAVIDQHLPPGRRWPWRVIEAVSRGLLAPAARRWKL
ncbi:MAG: hypothetical protein K8R23_02605 [Chthoniobacter sp.]|nr:hypothetical protein [Chthoniobacter sp.]